MKKNLFLMALAAVAMLATSCNKENEGVPAGSDRALSIKIAKVKGEESRSVEDPANSSVGTLQLVNGIIFICDPAGTITDAVQMIPGTGPNGIQSANGQVFPNSIKSDSKVYIAANIPATLLTQWSATITRPATLTAVNSELVNISDADYGQKYAHATLANVNAAASPIVLDPADQHKATVQIGMSPVYSRIELGSVKAENVAGDTDNVINSFDVTGVYVTDYYPSYTIGGGFGGSIHDQKFNTDFSSIAACMKDENTWSSNALVAKPDATTKVWAYNTPAGNLPRLILRVKNVDGTIGGTAADPTHVYYLTLTAYTKSGTPITVFERGKVYRVSEMKFEASKLADVPNSNRITLSVTVDILEWVIEDVDAEI